MRHAFKRMQRVPSSNRLGGTQADPQTNDRKLNNKNWIHVGIMLEGARRFSIVGFSPSELSAGVGFSYMMYDVLYDVSCVVYRIMYNVLYHECCNEMCMM